VAFDNNDKGMNMRGSQTLCHSDSDEENDDPGHEHEHDGHSTHHHHHLDAQTPGGRSLTINFFHHDPHHGKNADSHSHRVKLLDKKAKAWREYDVQHIGQGREHKDEPKESPYAELFNGTPIVKLPPPPITVVAVAATPLSQPAPVLLASAPPSYPQQIEGYADSAVPAKDASNPNRMYRPIPPDSKEGYKQSTNSETAEKEEKSCCRCWSF
jgi:hypothetical protein